MFVESLTKLPARVWSSEVGACLLDDAPEKLDDRLFGPVGPGEEWVVARRWLAEVFVQASHVSLGRAVRAKPRQSRAGARVRPCYAHARNVVLLNRQGEVGSVAQSCLLCPEVVRQDGCHLEAAEKPPAAANDGNAPGESSRGVGRELVRGPEFKSLKGVGPCARRMDLLTSAMVCSASAAGSSPVSFRCSCLACV